MAGMVPVQAVLRCVLCGFGVSAYRHDKCSSEIFEALGRGHSCDTCGVFAIPCSNCSSNLGAYDAGDGNQPAIVTDHRIVFVGLGYPCS